MDRQAHDYAAAAAYAQQKAAAVAQAHAHQFPGAGAAAAAAAAAGAVPGLPGFQQQFPHGQMHYLPPHHHLHPPMAHHHPSLQQQQFTPQFAHHQMQQQQQQQQQQHALHQYPPFQHLAQPQPQPQPQQIAFFGAWEQAPPPVPPPADPELQKRIDKLAEYAAKNGPEFEEKVRNEQQDNPAYSFLFGADGHAYYRYRLWLLSRSMSSAGYMAAAAAAAAPPPALNPVPSLHSLNPNPSPPLNPPPLHGSPIPLPHGAAYAGSSSSSFYDQPQIHPPQQPLPQHQQQPPPPVYGQTRADYEMPAKSFKGLSGPLPSDVAAELNNVVVNLTGTKESIKGAKTWFMQRSPFAPALAEALKGRVMALDDADKQLHIIYLANDILFDSLQRRSNPKDLDNEALAFQPVLGPMLAKIYHNPQNKDSNQSRLQKILQFWGSKEVYDAETIYNLEGEMIAGPPGGFGPAKDSVVKEPPMSGSTGIPSSATQNSQWHMESQRVPSVEKEQQDKTILSSSQFLGSSASIPPVYPSAAQPFHASVPSAAVPQQSSQLPGFSAGRSETQPPYPLFPPGLIPGMVRKMQIGSGVPYSPLSPLDIPSVIPPSTSSPTYILERVSKFFKEIGEVNPLEGQNTLPDPIVEEEEREPPIRTGGACIPPPPTLQVDPERGMLPDGSVEHRSGVSSSGRLGLGASADPNEVSQYDDVYTSYRKQRSSSYHTSMSARASAR